VSVSKNEFRAALGRFASGVTVVTTFDEKKERPLGITVSAFSSVSLEPPLVMICIEKDAYVHDYIKAFGAFAVNILTESQDEVSNLFASREADKFKDVSYSMSEMNLPLLDDVLVSMECRIVHAYEGGDHTIFVGEVITSKVAENNPLLYFQGGYEKLIR
jgi:flavin reductase (DIM6/NTAB) family NADH-FMN oxidoreductase RutF